MTGESVAGYPKLGFGLMRLPRKVAFTDVARTREMVDAFMEAGFRFFDAAPVYPGSEDTLRKTLVKRYPRESFEIATKVNAWISPVEKIVKGQIKGSLKRLDTDYLDYYTLHSLNGITYKTYDRFGIWEHAAELKAAGIVRQVGFSFHSDHELLDQLLTEHPEVDFVQLQLNYADWENPRIESRANYEVARRHGKPIVVMEPVKGGKLANPPKDVKAILDEADPEASYASWALRFVASLPGVLTVLSGMSAIGQVRDNITSMRDFRPLDEAEMRVIRAAQEAFGRSAAIPCTGCRYCVESCPAKIAIPDVLEAMNLKLVGGQDETARAAYAQAVKGGGRASECTRCGQCDRLCTQNIDVSGELARCAAALEAD